MYTQIMDQCVKLQCNICLCVAELNRTAAYDTIHIIPIVELSVCKHHLCLSCARQIRSKKKLCCPMCREENVHLNIYSVDRHTVNYIKCNVNNIFIWNKKTTNKIVNVELDAPMIAKIIFENSLLDEEQQQQEEEDEKLKKSNTFSINENDLNETLKQIKSEIHEQTKFNIKQKLMLRKLEDEYTIKNNTLISLQGKICKIKKYYDDLYKNINELRLKRITWEKRLDLINGQYTTLLEKNKCLILENKNLANKNIDLIKHKNLLLKEYVTLKQKTSTETINLIN